MVAAVGYHVQALRIAALEEDRLEMGRAWNNIGHALNVSGRPELAARSFQRSLALLEPVVASNQVRYAALANSPTCSTIGHIGTACAAAARVIELEDSRARILTASSSCPHPRRLLLASYRAGGRRAVHARSQTPPPPVPRAAIAVALRLIDLATGSATLRSRASLASSPIRSRCRHSPRRARPCRVRREAAGNPAPALLRLQELSDHVLATRWKRPRNGVEIAVWGRRPLADYHAPVRERLSSMLSRPAPPHAWSASAVSSALSAHDTPAGCLRGSAGQGARPRLGCPPLSRSSSGSLRSCTTRHGVGPPRSRQECHVQRRRARSAPPCRAGATCSRDPHSLLLAPNRGYHHARGTGRHPEASPVPPPLGARMCAMRTLRVLVCACRVRTLPRESLASWARSLSQFDRNWICFAAIVTRLELGARSRSGRHGTLPLVIASKEDEDSYEGRPARQS